MTHADITPDIKLNKELDQYLLSDSYIAIEVRDAELSPSDIVLEIGAGPGNLTRALAQKAKKVIALELDQRFLPQLIGIPKAEIVIGDAMKLDWPDCDKIVSNIPYSLSSKILLKMLKHKWSEAVIVVQNEFAQKLIKGTKLAAAVADCCELELLDKIPAGAFRPAAIDSRIIRLKQRKQLDEEFYRFVSELFRHKNKTISVGRGEKKKIHQLTLDELKILYRASA